MDVVIMDDDDEGQEEFSDVTDDDETDMASNSDTDMEDYNTYHRGFGYIGAIDSMLDGVNSSNDEDYGDNHDEEEEDDDDNLLDDDDEEADPDYHPSGPIDEAHSETQPVAEPSVVRTSVISSTASSINNDENKGASKCPEKSPNTEVKSELISSSQGSSGEEVCSICFEHWTNSGEHRLVSLKCGHLFGRSCITQWLKGSNGTCPQCKAKARKIDIRNIYAKSVKVVDSSERDKALEELKVEAQLRKAAEMEAAQQKIKHCLARQECERLKRELMEAQKQLQEYRSGSYKKCKTGQDVAKSRPPFVLNSTILIQNDGGCRLVNSDNITGMILVSSQIHNALFPGFGVRKVSTECMKPSDFVYIHKKTIRDMDYHGHSGLLLTASTDKTLKIVNMMHNCVVHTFNADSEVWSCAWDTNDSNYFYGGLKTGETYVYDIRVTNRYVYELPQFGLRTPVVSLQYLKLPQYSKAKGGPVIAKITDSAVFEKIDTELNYNTIPMPCLGPFTCLSVGEVPGNVLVSCRPSNKHPRISHTFVDVVAKPSGELNCLPVRTVFGGSTQVHLTRSKLISHPADMNSALICAGDEEANGALIWDASSGDFVENIYSEAAILDFTVVKNSQKFHLGALTSKSLLLYEWSDEK